MPWARTCLNDRLLNIRILKLHRGTDGAPIRCALQVVSLDDNSHYEALSYVWSSCNVTGSIYIDEVPFDTTASLFNFSHSLGLASADRYLWGDAICIDQNNEQEKSHQIGLMIRMYRQTDEAHVWFDPLNSNTRFQEFANDDKYTSLLEMTPKQWGVYQSNGLTSFQYLLKVEEVEPMG